MYLIDFGSNTMRTDIRLLTAVLLTLISIGTSSLALGESAVSDATIARLERFISKKMKRLGIPGAAVAVTEGDSVIYSKGFGVKRVGTEELVDTDTLFHIGSTHKAMTATLVATLVQDGVIGWNSTFGAIRSDLGDIDPWLADVQIRQLLNMTGGFVGEDEDNLYDQYSNDPSPEDLDAFVSNDFELARRPGERFEYSNMSASLAGYLCVYATGLTTGDLNTRYDALLRSKILDPLDMTRSTIFVTKARADSNFSYSHLNRGRNATVSESEDVDTDALAPSGSLKSSANELAQFVMLHARKGLAPNGTRLLAEGAFDELWTPSPVSGKERYALGWDARMIRKQSYLIHTGEFDNFAAVIAVLPSKQIGFLLLTNAPRVGNIQNKAVKFLFRKAARPNG